MKKSKALKAFSLIELSIVILIIGIIIAGVTQGTKLVSKMRLATARNFTQNSPVSGLKGLMVWFDTVADASFDDQYEDDGQTPDNWYDINPQSPSKLVASQPTVGARPTYTSSGINGLPTLKFNGGNYFVAAGNTSFSSDNSTVFLVLQVSSVVNDYNNVLNNFTIGPYTGYFIATYTASQWVLYVGSGSGAGGPKDISTIPMNTTILLMTSIAYDTTSQTATASIYRNGVVTAAQGGITPVRSYAPALTIGTGVFGGGLTGQLGEILIFDRGLKNEERKAVETYLSKKWGIKLS